MAAIFHATFSNAYLFVEMYTFRSRFHRSLYISALVQIMAWRRQGDKPLSEPIMVSLLTHICVTRPQLLKSNGRKFSQVSIESRSLQHTSLYAESIQSPAFSWFGMLFIASDLSNLAINFTRWLLLNTTRLNMGCLGSHQHRCYVTNIDIHVIKIRRS